MSKYPTGSAFPFAHVHPHGDFEPEYADGMTLRDYFAARVLDTVIWAYIKGNGDCIGTDHILRNVPSLAYKFADAMLKARSND